MRKQLLLIFLSVALLAGCTCNSGSGGLLSGNAPVLRGIYSFGPEVSTFTDCRNGREYWVTDSIAKLEDAYDHLGFERPYEPVYVELRGRIKISTPNGPEANYDSTVIVSEMLKIDKNIPPDCSTK